MEFCLEHALCFCEHGCCFRSIGAIPRREPQLHIVTHLHCRRLRQQLTASCGQFKPIHPHRASAGTDHLDAG